MARPDRAPRRLRTHARTWEAFGLSRRVVAGTAEGRREAEPKMNDVKADNGIRKISDKMVDRMRE